MRYNFTLEQWQSPRQPVTGPRFVWRDVRQVVIHYVGSGSAGVPSDIDQFLRNQQGYYLRSRGYSLGYNAAVVSATGHHFDGRSWEIRGDRYRCAANAGVNNVSYAILVIQRDNEAPTSAAVEGVRALTAQIMERRPNVVIVGHNRSGSTTATSCPGVGLTLAVQSDVFYPRPNPPQPLGDDMIAIYKPSYKGATADTPWVAVFQSGAVRRAVNADVRLAQQLNVPILDQDSKEQHEYLISIFP